MNNFNSTERLALRLISIIVLVSSSIFAFYIHIFGKITPGGGFQAGALLASGIIIYQIFNSDKIFSKSVLNVMTVIGVMLYILTGFASLMFNGVLFQYNVFHNEYGHIIGAFVVETGVFIVVTTSMVRISNIIESY